jgi:hypothetical protein
LHRSSDNPDRNFSAGPVENGNARELRDLLKHGEVASCFEEMVRRRVGELIGRAALKSRRRWEQDE